jgi:1,4-alpha-glucan branching enzyme
MIVFEKGDLLYIFNFHHTNSYENFEVGTKWTSDHFVLYDTEEERF